jgi:predicted branched-subunit amino acid permease
MTDRSDVPRKDNWAATRNRKLDYAFVALFVLLVTLAAFRGAAANPEAFGGLIARLALLLFGLQLIVRVVWMFGLIILEARKKK